MNRDSCRHSISRLLGVRVVAVTLISILVVVTAAGSAASATTLNAAGLVIKHGDGSVLYYYVQFSESEITGTQLLERAGVSIDITPYAGMGEAICRIDGEGCPSTNCFCKSYTNPAIYWRYHRLTSDGSWVTVPSGPDQRKVHNGDVDGWSWSAQDNDLPSVTLSQIAKINGVTGTTTTPPPSVTSAINTAAPTTSPTPDQRPTASPAALGVVVQTSGQTAKIQPAANAQNTGDKSYVWFGAGLALMFAVGFVAIGRRRRSGR